MLIPFDFLFEKYKIKATGVCHCGASIGEEADAYYKNGIKRSIWIEAIPEIFFDLTDRLFPYSDAVAINACISDKDGDVVEFHVSSNNGASSSFLELGTHAVVHPDVKYIRDIKCTTKRLITIFNENKLDIKDYTFWNMDLQGVELLALKGMGLLLSYVDYAYLEVNKAHLYVGCALIEEIDAYMKMFDFERVETEWAGNTNWGDAFYIKKHLLP